MKNNSDIPKIVKVEWIDAQTMKNRLSLEEIRTSGDAETITVGYLVDDTKDRIAICSWIHKFDDGNLYCDTHFIPRAIIKKITILKE